MSLLRKVSDLDREEIFRVIEAKKEKVEKDSKQWKPDAIKKQMEDDLARRVREALETPPLERIQKKKDREKKQTQRELEKQNSSLLVQLSNKEERKLRKWRESINIQPESPTMSFSTPSPVDFLFRDQLSKSNQDEYPGVFGLENCSEGIRDIREAYSTTVERFPPIKPRVRHFYTKDGFLQVLKSGKLPHGLKNVPQSENYMDKHGVVRSQHGPFWPTELVPLFPAPKLLKSNNLGVEPLYFQLPVNSQTVEKQPSPYSGKWRGILTVYDSERSQRDHPPQAVPDGVCPNLVFESRFECGNLRQARRVGQFEYELVLRTDLYTNRHTQWYYFRVSNTVPGITYKFRIVNLLKRDSLYNYGMRPLVYSEKDANENDIGWKRTGHHISYGNNIIHHTCPLLLKGVSYHMLEWQMEFPNSDDTYYLAHCYPYTFTDLKTDLDDILTDTDRQPYIKREVMCETRAGNSCFLLTVTNSEIKGKKKYVVITARVHPGETQASWMMRGLLYFLTSPHPSAQELRATCIFKIVPMLNPDGVIVGNYRCSLAARDLNRNYRHPRKENFPTIYNLKSMVDDLLQTDEVVLYCDLHGHSRKQNVFMYGNNKQNGPNGAVQSFISDRLFPWLMAAKSPEKFSFNSCKFKIKRCKESTGRVVMWRQMNIANSFTMEATFSGTVLDKTSCRHFNCRDFEEMGKTLCEVVLDYQRMKENKEYEMTVISELTRAITHQILANRGLLPKHVQLPTFNSAKVSDSGISVEGSDASTDTQTDTEKTADTVSDIPNTLNISESDYIHDNLKKTTSDVTRTQKTLMKPLLVEKSKKGGNFSSDEVQKVLEATSLNTVDGCLNILAQLNVCEALLESDSSDSDSETEPEMKPVELKQRKKKRKTRKQRDRENKKGQLECKTIDTGSRKTKLPVISDSGSRPVAMTTNNDPPSTCNSKILKQQALPVIVNNVSKSVAMTTQDPSSSTANMLKRQSVTERLFKQVINQQFISKYQGRTNGGVPCFTEERSLERAAKRMAELQRRSEKEKEDELLLYYCEGEFPVLSRSLSALPLQRALTEEEFNKRIQVALHEGTSNLTETLVGNSFKTNYTEHTGVRCEQSGIQQSPSFSLPITFPLVNNNTTNNTTVSAVHHYHKDDSLSDDSLGDIKSHSLTVPVAVEKSPYQYDTLLPSMSSFKHSIKTGPVLRSISHSINNSTPSLVTTGIFGSKSANPVTSDRSHVEKTKITSLSTTSLIGNLHRRNVRQQTVTGSDIP